MLMSARRPSSASTSSTCSTSSAISATFGRDTRIYISESTVSQLLGTLPSEDLRFPCPHICRADRLCVHRWLKNLYWNYPAFGSTTQFEHIKKVPAILQLSHPVSVTGELRAAYSLSNSADFSQHYTKSHKQINPHSITPLGPEPDILPLEEEVPAVGAAKK